MVVKCPVGICPTIYPDPFPLGQPDPESKNSAKIMENFHKNQPKS